MNPEPAFVWWTQCRATVFTAAIPRLLKPRNAKDLPILDVVAVSRREESAGRAYARLESAATDLRDPHSTRERRYNHDDLSSDTASTYHEDAQV